MFTSNSEMSQSPLSENPNSLGFYTFKSMPHSRPYSTHQSTRLQLSRSTDIVCIFTSNSEMSQSPLSENPNSLGFLHFQAHAPFKPVRSSRLSSTLPSTERDSSHSTDVVAGLCSERRECMLHVARLPQLDVVWSVVG